MSANEIDEYLRALDEPKRSTRQELQRAEEVISYRLPAFRVRGKIVAGFARSRIT